MSASEGGVGFSIVEKGPGVAKKKEAPRTAKTLKTDIAVYEKDRNVRGRPADGMVSIDPAKIKMLPHLFQPREIGMGDAQY